MVQAMEESIDNNLLQCSLAGLARDRGENAADMTCERALRILKQHSGAACRVVCNRP